MNFKFPCWTNCYRSWETNLSRKSVNGEGEGLEDVVFWLFVVLVLLFFAMMANECQWILWNPMGSKVGRIPLSIMANAPRVFSMPQKVWKDPKQNLLVWLINPLPPPKKVPFGDLGVILKYPEVTSGMRNPPAYKTWFIANRMSLHQLRDDCRQASGCIQQIWILYIISPSRK